MKIAFLGIGLMGKPMALRLMAAGHELVAFNRSLDKAEALRTHGASIAASVGAAVAGAQVVLSMLADGAAVAQVMADAMAQAGSLGAGAIWLDMSSTRQSEAQQFAAQLAAQGIGFVDAPVSGGVLGAEAGTLAIMAGGSAADYARVQALLQVLGRPTHVGVAGCGQLAKLCNQLIVGATLQVVAEALLLAQAGGADPAAVRQAIRGGFAESRILEVHGQRMLERNFMPGGQVKSQTKDLDNVLLAAQAAGLQLPLAQLVTDQYRQLLPLAPQADQSAALLGLERLNPGLRLGQSGDQLP
jgi:2-hydroxy-3-oxopropionate reductase